MRVLTIILISAVAGTLVGGALAYVEVWTEPSFVSLSPGSPQAEMPAPTDEKMPRAQIDEPHFEFGTMQRGTTKSHQFVVKNVGTAPLMLRVGQTSCKCALGEVSSAPIPPGGSAPVRLEWSAKSNSGPFRQTAFIQTNDPRQSQVELSVAGQVTEASGVEPPDLMFDKVSSGESKTAEVYVMAMLQDELTVSDPQLSDPNTRDKFDVRIEPVAREELPNATAKQGVRITVVAKPGLPIGPFNQWLSLRTNMSDAEKLEIPIIGRVVGDISIHGADWSEEKGVLILGSVKSSDGRRAKLNVVVRGAAAADVQLDVESCDPPELAVKIGEPRKLKESLVHVPIEIEVPAGTRPMVRLDTAQGEEARVVLKTTHPTIKELVLGVRFAVER